MTYKIAVLDDYQNVSQQMADWQGVTSQAEVVVFNDHLVNENEVIERLLPFDIVCVMRERTPLTKNILEKLPNLQLIVTTGQRNASIDTQIAEKLGIEVRYTDYQPDAAIELTWALILASARHIVSEATAVKRGVWQQQIGTGLKGKTLGILGLGRIGTAVARIGQAFGMHVIAWSENLTPERASEIDATYVTKQQLFEQADFLSVHLVLSDRTRHIVDRQALTWMKSSAYLINTSRGPLVDEHALLGVLTQHDIAGAAIDVYDQEPLAADHPFRGLDNLLATPHIGFVTDDLYHVFYRDTVVQIKDWLSTQ